MRAAFWSVDAELAREAATMPVATSLNVLTHARYVAVVGSRGYPELDRVGALVGALDPRATVVTGGAPGVDREAERLAGERGLTCAVVRPAGLMPSDYLCRNTVVVRGSDVVVAFWDGESTGTRDSIAKALLFHGFCIVALPSQEPQVWVPRMKEKR